MTALLPVKQNEQHYTSFENKTGNSITGKGFANRKFYGLDTSDWIVCRHLHSLFSPAPTDKNHQGKKGR